MRSSPMELAARRWPSPGSAWVAVSHSSPTRRSVRGWPLRCRSTAVGWRGRGGEGEAQAATRSRARHHRARAADLWSEGCVDRSRRARAARPSVDRSEQALRDRGVSRRPACIRDVRPRELPRAGGDAGVAHRGRLPRGVLRALAVARHAALVPASTLRRDASDDRVLARAGLSARERAAGKTPLAAQRSVRSPRANTSSFDSTCRPRRGGERMVRGPRTSGASRPTRHAASRPARPRCRAVRARSSLPDLARQRSLVAAPRTSQPDALLPRTSGGLRHSQGRQVESVHSPCWLRAAYANIDQSPQSLRGCAIRVDGATTTGISARSMSHGQRSKPRRKP